jgi:hypothetical protein
MRSSTLSVLLIAGSLSTACGGGGGGSGGSDTQALPGIYADAVNGSDSTGDGSYDRPYKTLTIALADAGIGDVVRLKAGTYGAANGESFPIRPGFGATIIGTEHVNALGRQQLSHIVGGAFWSGDPDGRLHAAIIPSFDNHLVGLSIHNPQPFVIGGAKPAAVLMAFSGVTLESCTLHDSDKGVRLVSGATGTLIKNCAFRSNGIGIYVDGAGADNSVEGCLVTENGAGLMCFSHGVDLGGGPSGSAGGNAFTDNNSNDVVDATGSGEWLYAENCFWDHAPPTSALGNPPSPADVDIWVLANGSVVINGAQLYASGSPFPGGGSALFP